MILKRLRNTLMSLAMLLLLLVSVITPVAANGENGEPEPEPPPAGPQGSIDDGYNGQFLVIICGSYDGYDWAEEWQQGTALAEPVSQVGTCSIASPVL